MPPPTPIDELLVEHCAAALRTLDGTDPDNYTITPNVLRIGDVDDPTDFDGSDGDLVVVPLDPELTNDQTDKPSLPGTHTMPLTWTLPVVCVYYSEKRKGEAEGLDTKLRRAAADIVRKLMQDPRRGGLATRQVILPPDFDLITGKVGVGVDIIYSTSQTDLAERV